MKIDHYQDGDVDILAIAGRLDAGSATEFEQKLTTTASAAVADVILDLEDVEYVGSAGLRVFLIGVRMLEAQGRKLLLSNVSEGVRDIIALTGFEKILTVLPAAGPEAQTGGA